MTREGEQHAASGTVRGQAGGQVNGAENNRLHTSSITTITTSQSRRVTEYALAFVVVIAATAAGAYFTDLFNAVDSADRKRRLMEQGAGPGVET